MEGGGFWSMLAKWMMAKAVFRYIAHRLSEASTWRSLFRLLTAIGIGISPGHWEAIAAVGIAAAELTGVAFPDRVRRRRVLDEPGRGDGLPNRGEAGGGKGVPGFDDLDRWSED